MNAQVLEDDMLEPANYDDSDLLALEASIEAQLGDTPSQEVVLLLPVWKISEEATTTETQERWFVDDAGTNTVNTSSVTEEGGSRSSTMTWNDLASANAT
jgi:hypothetical protein